MVLGFIGKEDTIFNKDCASSQDEGGKKVDVDVIPCTMEFPVFKHKMAQFHSLLQLQYDNIIFSKDKYTAKSSVLN